MVGLCGDGHICTSEFHTTWQVIAARMGNEIRNPALRRIPFTAGKATSYIATFRTRMPCASMMKIIQELELYNVRL